MIKNIKLLIQYDGTNFSGWQIQPGKRTVQQTLEEILSKILQEKIKVLGASRTDAGVHALGQVANFHTSNPVSLQKLFSGINRLLPEDIVVIDLKKVDAHFQSQRFAKKKTYRYQIWNSQVSNPLLRRHCWFVWSPLNLFSMRKASRFLLGEHDFSAFRAADSDTKTSIRTIFKIKIRRDAVNSPLLLIEIIGNGFLKYMVRNIVGTLVEVGKGHWKPERVQEILQSKDRRQAGITAPARGLFLFQIHSRV